MFACRARPGRQENEGWPLITNQLNHERVALTSSAPDPLALAEVRSGRIKTGAIDQEWVRLNLARVHAKVELLKLINWRIASTVQQRAQPGRGVGHQGVRHRVRHRGVPAADGGARPERAGQRRLAGSGAARPHGARAPAALILTFGGGTNEVQRDIIAAAGLGLPAAKR